MCAEQETREIELTSDERRVLAELALGYTDDVAAARLGMSRRTLRRRVRDAMDKLGARSRFQAGLLYAARHPSGPIPAIHEDRSATRTNEWSTSRRTKEADDET